MQKSRFRKALPMILLVIPLLYIVFLTPFEGPVQTIVVLLYLGVVLGITIWDSIQSWRKADEVQMAAARFSVSTGAVLGLACTVAFVILMTHVPAVAKFIASIAEISKLPPAAAGFGLGAMMTLILVFIGGHIAYAAWVWQISRR